MEEKNPIQVADRLFQAVELLCDRGAMGLMDISAALGLNKSTAHRVISSLIYMGYVKQNPENSKYEMTFKIVDLSNKLMSKVDIVDTVKPYLRQLMQLTGETVHFVERDGTEVVYIDKEEASQNTVQMISHIGSRIPVYCSGVGKAMAATLSLPEVEQIWKNSEIIRRTPYTITNYEEFLYTLEEVRRKGYALDNEENETGVRCIAAALPGKNGEAKYAFSISAPINRMDNDRILELAGHVLAAREQLINALR